MMKKEVVFAYLGLILMTLIIGFSFIFVKIGLNFSNPYDLLAHRFNAAFLVILILLISKKVKFPKISFKKWIKIILIAMFYPVLCFGLQAVGMVNSTASEAGLIFAFLPVFMLLAGNFFLKEKSSFIQKAGVFLSVFGIIFILYFKQGLENFNIWSIIFLFLSVLSMIGYFILGKKEIANFNSLSLTAIMISLGFLFFNLISISRHLIKQDLNLYFEAYKSSQFIFSILYLGILSSVFSSFLSNYSLNYIPTFQISIFSNLNPIIAIFGGVLILNDSFLWFDFIGASLVIIGVILVLFFKSKQNQDKKPT
ncbi:MAG: DMT family transporter [Bacteroidales bacterium]|jgi:drug/metabolite transporter (DMT)-like permease|nr:DMT family transporter [Bacteroidales bacterium]MDY0314336.1 DMT family transporter [Bacteroidales bacterium]NLB86896.1 DMT family transporter [Bacteroidales bacterium]